MLVNLVIRSRNVIITIDGVLKLHTTEIEDTKLDVTYQYLKSNVYKVKTFDHSKIDQMINGYSCVHDFVLYILVNIQSGTVEYLQQLFHTNDLISCIVYLMILYVELRDTRSVKHLVQAYIQNVEDRWRLEYILIFKSILTKITKK